MVYLLGLSAAVLLAVGFVLQQHAAEAEPSSMRLSFRLLVALAHRPRWLLGIASMVCGQVLGAAAFGFGPVALVEPLLASNLIFALTLGALYQRRRVGKVDLLGSLVLVAGLAVFVVAGAPDGGSPRTANLGGWITTFLAVGAAVTLLLAAQRKAGPVPTAKLLAFGAGLLFGVQDTLTQAADTLIDHGIDALVTSWIPYTIILVAVGGLVLNQSAFEAAPLSASLPALTAAEPLTGILLGLVLYNEHLRNSPLGMAGEILGLAALVWGIFILGRSPLVTGELHDIDSQAPS